ncbi:MAG: hypothetical protein ACYSRZ_07905 [Planctomycetota bacterium]|jgi:hypothetical protein
MTGMFYSLKETVQKLNKNEDQLKELVKTGRLREFRDGENLLFKISEVDSLLSDTDISLSQDAPDSSATSLEPDEDEDEIQFAPQLDDDAAEGTDLELTQADTDVTSEGINVLGESDSDYQLADDALAETQAASEEASLAKIEEDVNLDTFGSGSGLLDLSLQADDTSLGGILDEIYTPEGENGKPAPEASVMEVAAEAEHIVSEEEAQNGQIAAVAMAYAEPEPDLASNTLGMLLFLPLLTVVYTTIITLTAFNSIKPLILTSIQGIIWYITIAATVLALITVAVAFMLGQPRTVRPARKKKSKKDAEPDLPAEAKEQ